MCIPMAGQWLNKHVCNLIQIYQCSSRVMSIFTKWPWLAGLMLSKTTSMKKVLMHASGKANVDMLHPCGHLLRKVWPLGSLLCDVFVTFSNITPDSGHNMGNFFHMVSWIRCGIWLYGFLIVAFFITFTLCIRMQSVIKIYRAVQELLNEHFH